MAGSAKSVFHFDVQGSVAKSPHAGMPWLRFIRQRLGSRIHFWPFDSWDIPTGRSAIVEVYPSLWNRGYAWWDRTGDQHDAYCIAAWLSRADRSGNLTASLKPDLTAPELSVAKVEGWILGVAGLMRDTPGSHEEIQADAWHGKREYRWSLWSAGRRSPADPSTRLGAVTGMRSQGFQLRLRIWPVSRRVNKTRSGDDDPTLSTSWRHDDRDVSAEAKR
jgi:hypothetical protein